MTNHLGHSNPQHCVLDGIRRMYDEQRFTDVDVHVENMSFRCHSLVLSAVSPYFDAMFSSGMRESTEMSVNLHGVNSDIFSDVLAFIYTGQDVVTSDNVTEMLQIASMIQLNCLLEKCEDFMIKNIDSDNCLKIWKIAKLHNCKNLKEISELHILNNFEEISANSDMLLFDFEDICSIIKDENLKVANEETVCMTILKWVQYDEETRAKHLSVLFDNVHLMSVRLEFLLDELDQHPLIVGNQECMQTVKNAIRFHALPARRQAFADVSRTFRRNDEQEQILTVVGRRMTSEGSQVNEFIGYSYLHKRWLSLPGIPFNIGEDFAVCSYGDDIYISGGTENLHLSIQYSAKFSQWRKRAPLNCGRYRHSMVAVRNSLFVLGGYNFGTLSSIEEYDIESECWKHVGDLQQSVDEASAAALGDRIFVFGGWLGFAEETAAIQCFDTRSYCCTKLSLLPKPCKSTKALAVKDRIYIMCSDGELISFNTSDGYKITNVVRDFSRRNFGIFSDKGGLCIVGGERNKFSDGVDYNICDDAIQISGTGVVPADEYQLPVPMEVFGCLKIVVHKKYPLVEYSSVREFETD